MRHRSGQAGFTYVVVLAAVAIMLVTAGVAEELTSHRMRVERETELLFRGNAYRHAIESFYRANGRYPHELQDLVRDPHAAHRRYLRSLYQDPMAQKGTNAWQVVQSADGGIAGVASSSGDEPLKRSGFSKELKSFSEAKSYRDWVFEYLPRRAGVTSSQVTATATNLTAK